MIGSPMPVFLSKDATIEGSSGCVKVKPDVEALPTQMSRIAVLAAVYDYWKSKRNHWQKPFLHRLQPPPPVNDTNPFNIFRPREKAHRPHTQCLPESGTSQRNSTYHATGVYDFCNILSWDLSFPYWSSSLVYNHVFLLSNVTEGGEEV
ncbi:unnamed protein product [Sphagnum compactum]